MGERLKNQAAIEKDPSYHKPRTIVAKEARRVAEERESEVRRRYPSATTDLSSQIAAEAEDVYRRARARGCDHPRAIRVLGRAWARIL